jgi:O-antigen/teichoic acid export membrane protein
MKDVVIDREAGGLGVLKALRTDRRPRRANVQTDPKVAGVPWLVASELCSGAIGFGVTVHFARRLGAEGFAHLEYASAVAAWLLVIVRSGVEMIAVREAARRPRILRPMTEAMIGLKLAAAVLGYGLVLALALSAGGDRGRAVAVSGLILLPSALLTDLAPRASGKLMPVAIAQVVRSLGYAAAGWLLVGHPGQEIRAASCAIVAEVLSSLVLWIHHVRTFGVPVPRVRRKAWAVLAKRGLIASLVRFGRVTLYGADLLVLGWPADAELGNYAAARRVVFALVSVGLVLPAAFAPAIAQGWARGAGRARLLLGDACSRLLSFALPAAIGLTATSEVWMPRLFGPDFQGGGPWLALLAARLPWLLVASLHQSALVACRRESDALRLILLSVAAAAIALPLATARGGPWAAGLVMLGLEMAGVIAGWWLLDRLGAAPSWHHEVLPPLVGGLVLGGVCRFAIGWPPWALILAGSSTYAAVWLALRPRGPLSLGARRALP